MITPIIFYGSEISLKEIYISESHEASDAQYEHFCDSQGVYLAKYLAMPKAGDFSYKVKKYIGQPIDQKLLDNLRNFIIRYYRDHGYPLVGVSFPAGQNITQGSLYINVLIARIGEIKSTGAKWFPDEWFAEQISLEKGDEIVTAPLMQDLNWINRSPFTNTALIYEKGDDLGDTNLHLVTRDKFPLRVFAGYENNGNIIGGDSRYITGLNTGRVFTKNDRFNYQFITADSTKRWWANSADYILPLPWRHILKVSGLYSRTKPRNFDSLIDSSGKQWQVNGRYSIVLPSFTHYLHEITVGYDFKRTNNFLTFSQALIFANDFDVSQFIIGYEGTYEDRFGFILWGIDLYISPGNMTAFNKDCFYRQERSGTKSNYFYGRVSLSSIVRLPMDFSWAVSSLGQFSSGKLLPIEELSLGGYLTIRGYDENELISDEGFYIKNEFRSPPISVLKRVHRRIEDKLQFLVFIDFGCAHDIDQNILDSNTKVLASIGPGIRYNIMEYLNFWFDYGFQLNVIHGRPFTSGNQRAHIGLTAGF